MKLQALSRICRLSSLIARVYELLVGPSVRSYRKFQRPTGTSNLNVAAVGQEKTYPRASSALRVRSHPGRDVGRNSRKCRAREVTEVFANCRNETK